MTKMALSQTIALSRLRKRFGKSFYCEMNEQALPKAERESKQEEGRIIGKERDEVLRLMTERKDALLAADAEYQTLLAQTVELRAKKDEATKGSHTPKIQVGTLDNSLGIGMFHVAASGDTWEEIFEALAAYDIRVANAKATRARIVSKKGK